MNHHDIIIFINNLQNLIYCFRNIYTCLHCTLQLYYQTLHVRRIITHSLKCNSDNAKTFQEESKGTIKEFAANTISESF